MTDYIVPVLLFLAAALALGKRENAYDLLLQGGADGLKLLVTILPALVLLLTAVHMLRASGAVALLSRFFAPVFSFFGIPPEKSRPKLSEYFESIAVDGMVADETLLNTALITWRV